MNVYGTGTSNYGYANEWTDGTGFMGSPHMPVEIGINHGPSQRRVPAGLFTRRCRYLRYKNAVTKFFECSLLHGIHKQILDNKIL